MHSAYRRFMSWFDYSSPAAIMTIGGVGGGLYGAYSTKKPCPQTCTSKESHRYLQITVGCAKGIVVGALALPVFIVTSPIVVPAYIYTKFNSAPEPEERTLCNRI